MNLQHADNQLDKETPLGGFFLTAFYVLFNGLLHAF